MCEYVWQYVFAMIVLVFSFWLYFFLLAWSHDIAGRAWLVFLFLRSFYSFMLIVIYIGMLRCKATVCGCVYSLCVAGLYWSYSQIFILWLERLHLSLIWDLCVWFVCGFLAGLFSYFPAYYLSHQYSWWIFLILRPFGVWLFNPSAKPQHCVGSWMNNIS